MEKKPAAPGAAEKMLTSCAAGRKPETHPRDAGLQLPRTPLPYKDIQAALLFPFTFSCPLRSSLCFLLLNPSARL